jgi:hypothetical protein
MAKYTASEDGKLIPAEIDPRWLAAHDAEVRAKALEDARKIVLSAALEVGDSMAMAQKVATAWDRLLIERGEA